MSGPDTSLCTSLCNCQCPNSTVCPTVTGKTQVIQCMAIAMRSLSPAVIPSLTPYIPTSRQGPRQVPTSEMYALAPNSEQASWPAVSSATGSSLMGPLMRVKRRQQLLLESGSVRQGEHFPCPDPERQGTACQKQL